ncbi:iron-sulfur protein [Streptomyces fumigatiscleroticus]|nr:iron-sulfur protein [Streptomyces fumigatiscleroticus]
MTHPATRRALLLATGATALAGGCGDDSGSSSASEASGKELTRTDDVPVGGGTVLKDDKVVVTQPEKDRFKAFSAVCTHQGCTVADVSGSTINCACHGSRFRIADGSVAAGPATEPLPAKEITVDGNSVRLT